MKPRLLITGGLGTVGRLLLAELRDDFRVRITARVPPDRADAVTAPDELLHGDLLDADVVRRCMRGVDAVLHLAANASPAATVQEALDNVQMADLLLDAARREHVGTVVVASSVHASGLDYRDGLTPIRAALAPRPCCPYGAGKVAIEALARLFQEESGAAVSCLRLGLTGWELREREYAHTWLSTPDLRRLVRAALARPAGFGIYPGVSLDAAAVWDTSAATAELGWAPRDRWPVDVASLPPAASSPCQLFRVQP